MLMTFLELLFFLWFISWGNFVTAQWNTNDYMKREHSLVKPYQCKILVENLYQYYIDITLNI